MSTARHPAPEPLANDGVLTIAIGTALFAIAFVVLLAFWHRLDDAGHLWWIATCACGAGLGLIGLAICIRRSRRLGLR